MKDKKTTQLERKFHLRDVTGRWKSKLNTDKMVYVLSPYITSETAEDVLENVENCEIYTDFNIENFVKGASSITTLKNLIHRGFDVYFIPHLHAKIILIDDKFVSIGSQNLTKQGTYNKEATFTSTSLDVVKFVEGKLKNWFIERKKVSLELLEDLENRIISLKELYDDFKDELEQLELEIEAEKNDEIEENLKRFIANFAKIEKTQTYIQGSIRLDSNYRVWTFMPDSIYGSDLLNWQIGSERIELEKTTRYLSLIENTGKLGWARVMKTRITYYESSVRWSDSIQINGKYYKITFEANWEQSTLADYNLSIRMDNVFFPDEYGTIMLWFDSEKLEITDIQPTSGGMLGDWIEENFDSFKNIILQKLVSPFKYGENLTGEQANEFFDESKYELRLGRIENQPILLFSEV